MKTFIAITALRQAGRAFRYVRERTGSRVEKAVGRELINAPLRMPTNKLMFGAAAGAGLSPTLDGHIHGIVAQALPYVLPEAVAGDAMASFLSWTLSTVLAVAIGYFLPDFGNRQV